MNIRAKFQCANVETLKSGPDGEKYGEQVSFHAVYAEEGPNKVWSEATPCGSVSMTITNKAAWGAFEEGKEYFLDFTLVNE